MRRVGMRVSLQRREPLAGLSVVRGMSVGSVERDQYQDVGDHAEEEQSDADRDREVDRARDRIAVAAQIVESRVLGLGHGVPLHLHDFLLPLPEAFGCVFNQAWMSDFSHTRPIASVATGSGSLPLVTQVPTMFAPTPAIVPISVAPTRSSRSGTGSASARARRSRSSLTVSSSRRTRCTRSASFCLSLMPLPRPACCP